MRDDIESVLSETYKELNKLQLKPYEDMVKHPEFGKGVDIYSLGISFMELLHNNSLLSKQSI